MIIYVDNFTDEKSIVLVRVTVGWLISLGVDPFLGLRARF